MICGNISLKKLINLLQIRCKKGPTETVLQILKLGYTDYWWEVESTVKLDTNENVKVTTKKNYSKEQ